MTKPFDPTELVEVVREAIGGRRGMIEDRLKALLARRGGGRRSGARRSSPRCPSRSCSDLARRGSATSRRTSRWSLASHVGRESAGDGGRDRGRRCPPRRSSRRRRWRAPASSTCGRPTTGSTTCCGRSSRRASATARARPTGRAHPGGVRLREPDRPAHDRSRAQRRDRRRARPAPDVRRSRGRARVLLQRRRRPDGSLRRVRRGPVPRSCSAATRRCPRTATTATT